MRTLYIGLCLCGFYSATLLEAKTLNLSEAYYLAASCSPSLAAAESEVGIKQGEYIQASMIPNPALDIDVDSFGGTGDFCRFDDTVITYELQQLVETCGKRGARQNLASMDKQVALWEVDEMVAELMARVKETFIEVALSFAKVDIFKGHLEFTSASLEAVQDRVANGKEAPTQLHKARIEQQMSQIHLANLQRELELKKALLSSFWSQECIDFDAVDMDLYRIPSVPDFEWVKERLLCYPGILKAEANYAKAEKRLQLERRNSCPDVLLSLGVNHLVKRNEYGFKVEVNFPIPIFDYNQGKICAANHSLEQALHQKNHFYFEFLNQARVDYKELQDSYQLIREYENGILTYAEAAYEDVHEGFKQGKFHYIEMLDAQRTFFSVREEYLVALARYHTLMAKLEKYTGSITCS